jgi:hypothetical protein
MIVVSGTDRNKKVRYTGGHTKISELIGVSTKIAVTETIKKHKAWSQTIKNETIFS